jgi:hypothetical protein
MAKSVKGTKLARIHKPKKVTKAVEEATTASEAIPTVPQQEPVTVEAHQAAPAVATPATPVTETATPAVTRSPEAKANIAVGLAAHKLAGRPTKAQLISVFGKAGYLLSWPQRTERFGITPATFQAALAKGVPAIRLGPGAQTVVEVPKEKA